MLNVRGLTVKYGEFQALRDIDIAVTPGELVVLLGSNGAGKSTLFRTLSGLVQPSAGTILFAEKNIDALKAHQIVKAGIAHCPEDRKLFSELSVLKNLTLGAYHIGDKSEIKKSLEWVFGLFPVLYEKRNAVAGSLSGGQQQMVAIGRALMARPKLLLLDEPSLGLAPLVVQQVWRAVVEINKTGTMVLMAEQNAYAALQIAHRGYIIDNGRIVMEGSREELMNNRQVKEAYLGV